MKKKTLWKTFRSENMIKIHYYLVLIFLNVLQRKQQVNKSVTASRTLTIGSGMRINQCELDEKFPLVFL